MGDKESEWSILFLFLVGAILKLQSVYELGDPWFNKIRSIFNSLSATIKQLGALQQRIISASNSI